MSETESKPQIKPSKRKKWLKRIAKWSGFTLLFFVSIIVAAEAVRQYYDARLVEDLMPLYERAHKKHLGDRTALERWGELLTGKNGLESWIEFIESGEQLSKIESTTHFDGLDQNLNEAIAKWHRDYLSDNDVEDYYWQPADSDLRTWLNDSAYLIAKARNLVDTSDYIALDAPNDDPMLSSRLAGGYDIGDTLQTRIFAHIELEQHELAEAELLLALEVSDLFKGPTDFFEFFSTSSFTHTTWASAERLIEQNLISDEGLDTISRITLDRTAYMKQFIERQLLMVFHDYETSDEGDLRNGWFDWVEEILDDPFEGNRYEDALECYMTSFNGLEEYEEFLDVQIGALSVLAAIDGDEPMESLYPDRWDWLTAHIDRHFEWNFQHSRTVQLAAKVRLLQRTTSSFEELQAKANELADETPKVSIEWDDKTCNVVADALASQGEDGSLDRTAITLEPIS